MTQETRLRRPVSANGYLSDDKQSKDKRKVLRDDEFRHRESPLTVLKEESPHIRAIYHIFIVILVVLLFDTAIYDVVERGKINIGFDSVKYGFGDVVRAGKLWIYLFTVAVSFYPLLRIFERGAKLFHRIPVLDQVWRIIGVIGVLAIQTCLVGVPSWDLWSEHLALGSSITITCEMFRFAMKVHAISVECGPRCYKDTTPLPTFNHYLYFLFAPTLLYRDQYPRTKNIRWARALFNFTEVAAIIFYNSFLWERFILPYWSDYGRAPTVEAGQVVRGIFACVLPGVISFLSGFYCLLHAWLNAFAEILRFGDRLFYEEWWTTSQFSRYYRAWNRVVHCWLRDYIYQPSATKMSRPLAQFFVFFVSSIVHEIILALSFGFFYPVLLLLFGGFGVLMLPLTYSSGQKFPNIFNFIMWLTFFFGNGILWSLYPMEHFARKNCPTSPNDSFFIPKSWSCPEVVLKPDWTFNNPFHVQTT